MDDFVCVCVCVCVCFNDYMKLIGPQLVKKFHSFYGTQRFITAFTRVHHLSSILSHIKTVLGPLPTPNPISGTKK